MGNGVTLGYLGLTIDGYENWDEGNYCGNCDDSFYVHPVIIPIDRWYERYACPLCGHIEPKVFKTDYFYDVALYLLQVADDDTWPDWMPKYES